MILYQKKAVPFFLRLLGAIFNPIIMIFFIVPVGALVYYALQGDISTSPVKGMWFGASFLLFLSTFAYYNIIKNAITQLIHADLSSEGLKTQKVKYDKLVETVIPLKEIQLELKKQQNKNAKRSGEWYSYVLEFFDGKSIEPVFALHEKQEILQEILSKIEQENIIPLRAAEKDFLLLARRPEKFSFLKTYRRISQIGAVFAFLFLIYKAVPFVKSLSFVEESGLEGSWKVVEPKESAGMLITFNSDSSANESVFRSQVKWKLNTTDSAALLTIVAEASDGNGSKSYTYSFVNRNDSLIILKRDFDQRLFRLIKSNDASEDVSEFKKLVGICDRSYIMPVTMAIEDELLKKYLPDWKPDQRPGKTLLKNDHYVFLLDGYSGSYVAVFNSASEVFLRHQIFEGVLGECSNSFSTVVQNGVEFIQYEYHCIEGDPTITYYQVGENGKLVATNQVDLGPGTSAFDEAYEIGEPYNDQTSYPAPQGGLQVGTATTNQLLKNFFKAFGSDEWDRKKFQADNSINLLDENDQPYGLGIYLAGAYSVYEKYKEYFMQDFADKEACGWPYWPCHFQSISGIVPILTKADEHEKFNRYNAEFIRWAYTQLIPEPTTELLNGLTARDIYSKVFRRFFRIYTLAYCHLQRNDFSGEQQQYQQAASTEQYFSGTNYLRVRYVGVVPNFESQDYSQQMEPSLAIGFWLRRGIDGTEKDCWLGLQKAMNKYDPIWFHKTLVYYGLEPTPQ